MSLLFVIQAGELGLRARVKRMPAAFLLSLPFPQP